MCDTQNSIGSQSTSESHWTGFIPWFITIASTIATFALGWFLISNIYWFKSIMFPEGKEMSADYTLYACHLFLSMIKRSVALFAGFTILFIGSATIFYSVKESTKVNMQSPTISFVVATTSPGILAMLLGGGILMFTIHSKDTFTPYQDKVVHGKATEKKMTQTRKDLFE